MTTKNIGQKGEDIAYEYLIYKGYSFLDRNFSSKSGEIDLIFVDGEYLVFVEVKLRKNINYGYPRDFVTADKQRKIMATAQYYMESKELYDLQPRFDIVEIIGDKNIIEHIENAFP